MTIRVRFAPSPTGQVHIGNIRTAIFNWLFARHNNGKFLLRVEDTDLERSTKEAVDALMECMQWMGLDYDEDVMYQSKRKDAHLEAVERLINDGYAYKPPALDGENTPVIFRIPINADELDCVRVGETTEIEVHPEAPVKIDVTGINYSQISRKGKAVPSASSLTGMKDLKVYNSDGEVIFSLADKLDAIISGEESFQENGCAKFEFTRKEVFFTDIIKGELAKPLDTVKDLVIVRSDGSPVFHIANVCDDAAQNITHIVRGDDHVENTYRHILLFKALGYDTPQYAHMPMIVNEAGKPYSKRDGDAFVGDFRLKGFLSNALFNYLSLLGWSPGDDREKMSKMELVEAFTLERVKSSPARFDNMKLMNLNGQYLAEMPFDEFFGNVKAYAKDVDWYGGVSEEQFLKVAEMMQVRTKIASQLDEWEYFFVDQLEYQRKPLKKAIKKEEIQNALTLFSEGFAQLADVTPESVEKLVRETEKSSSLDEGKLNKPLRLCATAKGGGADIYHTLAVIGSEKVVKRIKKAVELINTPVEG